jgi:hypothetical protein
MPTPHPAGFCHSNPILYLGLAFLYLGPFSHFEKTIHAGQRLIEASCSLFPCPSSGILFVYSNESTLPLISRSGNDRSWRKAQPRESPSVIGAGATKPETKRLFRGMIAKMLRIEKRENQTIEKKFSLSLPFRSSQQPASICLPPRFSLSQASRTGRSRFDPISCC